MPELYSNQQGTPCLLVCLTVCRRRHSRNSMPELYLAFFLPFLEVEPRRIRESRAFGHSFAGHVVGSRPMKRKKNVLNDNCLYLVDRGRQQKTVTDKLSADTIKNDLQLLPRECCVWVGFIMNLLTDQWISFGSRSCIPVN